MLLVKWLTEIAGYHAGRQGPVCGLSRGTHRRRRLLLERLENRLCLSLWSEPVNLGPVVNSSSIDGGPALSPDGLSLYFSSNRPGSFGYNDIWVSQRASLSDPWGPPRNLGRIINQVDDANRTPTFSPDGHRMFFVSGRPGSLDEDSDIWVSWRDDIHDDFGWQSPVNLGPVVNSQSKDEGPEYFQDPVTGITTLYFASTRLGGPEDYDIFASTLQSDGTFGAPVLVPELSSPYFEHYPAIRSDGLEMFISSRRPGGIGGSTNIWVSTRASTLDRWSTPVNLRTPINLDGFDSGLAELSSDGNTLFFGANLPGGLGTGLGAYDLWMSTRLPLVADHFTLSSPTSTTAGQAVSLILTAWDHYGNIATGYTGTVTFVSSDPQTILPPSYTFTAADNGTHAFDITFRTAGAQSIKVTDTVGEVIGAQAGLVVNPAAADHFLITTAPTVISGAPFDVTVTALDTFGNLDINYQGTVTFSTTDPGTGVVLPAEYTFTIGDGGDNGVHTFPGGVLLVTLGDQTFTIIDTISGISGSATLTVGPSP
jgi:hypothetical protein